MFNLLRPNNVNVCLSSTDETCNAKFCCWRKKGSWRNCIDILMQTEKILIDLKCPSLFLNLSAFIWYGLDREIIFSHLYKDKCVLHTPVIVILYRYPVFSSVLWVSHVVIASNYICSSLPLRKKMKLWIYDMCFDVLSPHINTYNIISGFLQNSTVMNLCCRHLEEFFWLYFLSVNIGF